MTTLQLLFAIVSSLMLAIAPVLPCAMGSADMSHSANQQASGSKHACCDALSQLPEACPVYSDDSSDSSTPAVRCCCGPVLATVGTKVSFEPDAMWAAAPLASSANTPEPQLTRLLEEPILLRPPLVLFLSVWRC
jgi:hypothetical protein